LAMAATIGPCDASPAPSDGASARLINSTSALVRPGSLAHASALRRYLQPASATA
jgi:hypothetical protein